MDKDNTYNNLNKLKKDVLSKTNSISTYDIPKEDGLTTPNGYFNNLKDSIDLPKQGKVVSFSTWTKGVSIAASIALIFGLFTIIYNNNTSTTGSNDLLADANYNQLTADEYFSEVSSADEFSDDLFSFSEEGLTSETSSIDILEILNDEITIDPTDMIGDDFDLF